jgi:hypothetical protein
LTSALDESEWKPSRSSRFTPREVAHGTNCIGGWVDLRAILEAVVKSVMVDKEMSDKFYTYHLFEKSFSKPLIPKKSLQITMIAYVWVPFVQEEISARPYSCLTYE